MRRGKSSDAPLVGVEGAHVPPCGITGKLHDDVFDMIRVGDLAKDKAIFFTGGLHVHVTEIEYRWDNAFDGHGDILDAGKVELAYLPDEQSFLLDVDDAVIGDDPDIEVIVDPREEPEEPHENEERVFNEDKEPRALGSHYFWEKDGKHEGACDEEEREKKDDKKMGQDIEPVAMDDKEDFFVVTLPLKMTLIESVRHRVFQ